MALEEGTCAAWLHDLLKPHVTKVLVCDPRKNSLLKAGNKNDRIDARKLADLLRTGLLSAVYHGENGPFPAPASKSTHHAIVRNGSARSPKPACAAEPSSTTGSSMRWLFCASKYGRIC